MTNWGVSLCPECSFLPNSLAHRCSTMASDFISLSQGGHTVVPDKRKEVKTVKRWQEASTSSTHAHAVSHNPQGGSTSMHPVTGCQLPFVWDNTLLGVRHHPPAYRQHWPWAAFCQPHSNAVSGPKARLGSC